MRVLVYDVASDDVTVAAAETILRDHLLGDAGSVLGGFGRRSLFFPRSPELVLLRGEGPVILGAAPSYEFAYNRADELIHQHVSALVEVLRIA
jgi:hypothetical protein